MPPSASQPGSFWRISRWLLRQCENCLALIGLFVIIYWLCFDLSTITSPSMGPALQGTNWRNGDRVLTEHVSYWFRHPARWEVVCIRRDNGAKIMKRVVGLPGEKLEIREDGGILINGSPIDPPADFDCPKYRPIGDMLRGEPVDCGAGYYVLGDDTSDSDDSRYNGPVPLEKISGRAWLIVAPRARIGFVNP
jgi:signal peptidase I